MCFSTAIYHELIFACIISINLVSGYRWGACTQITCILDKKQKSKSKPTKEASESEEDEESSEEEMVKKSAATAAGLKQSTAKSAAQVCVL